MTGFETIRNAISATLAPLARGAGRVLQYTYAHIKENPDGYPCAMFDVSDIENTFLRNKSNRRGYTWNLYVLVLIPKDKEIESATYRLDKTCDAIVETIENDITLGGVVDWCIPLTGAREQVETPQGYALMQTLNLTTVVGTDCA